MRTEAPRRAAPVPPRRRAARRSRRGRVAAALALSLLGLSAGAWLLAGRLDPGTEAPGGPSRLALLAVVGGDRPFLAVVGALGAPTPAAVTFPPEALIVVPGYGEATVAEAAALPGPMLRTGAANALGRWVESYGVVGLDALAAAVDRAGGLPVRLPAALSPTGEPDGVTFAGDQLGGFLGGDGESAELRWHAVLGALLGSGVLEEVHLTEGDGPEVLRILGAARGAEIAVLPAEPLREDLLRPDPAAVARLAAELFGGPAAEPLRVAVLNGSGTPGIGRLVAERLLPAGFRVVLSENAETFDHATTTITATGREHRAAAERVRELLGVGAVVVSRVPSGFSDIAIVVGEDLG